MNNARRSSVELDEDFKSKSHPGRFSAEEIIDTEQEFLKDPSKAKEYCNY